MLFDFLNFGTTDMLDPLFLNEDILRTAYKSRDRMKKKIILEVSQEPPKPSVNILTLTF